MARPSPNSGTKTSAAAPPPVAPPAPPQGSAYGSDFDFDDEMEIDRNGAPAPLVTASTAPRPLVKGRIELGDNAPRYDRGAREDEELEPRTDWLSAILSTALVGMFAGGSGYALFRYVHRSAGWNVAPLAQKALDGGSATWSGASSLSFLALSITLTIMAMYAKPRSLAYGFSALCAVVIGVTLMIITFSVGPDGAPDVPPDGAILVPWLLALIPLGVAFRMLRNAWSSSYVGGAKNRLHGVLFAAFAAAFAFAAIELLLGAGVMRLASLF